MTVGDTQEVFVKGKVDESDIGKVFLGQTARIKVESFKDKTFDGKVTKILPMGVEKDNATTFEVRVSITNPGGELKAAMTANAEIILEEHKNVLYIPEGALIYDKDKKASVEVPDPKAPEGKKKVAVTVGISNGSKTELLTGLKKDDKVILQHQTKSKQAPFMGAGHLSACRKTSRQAFLIYPRRSNAPRLTLARLTSPGLPLSFISRPRPATCPPQ